jgi:hypothetical protein
MKETLKYCDKNEGLPNHYRYFHLSRLGVEMHLMKRDKRNIIQVKVKENIDNVDSPYWAYWRFSDNRFVFVQPSELQLKLCSGDFFQNAINRGEGVILNVVIEELTAVQQPTTL